jgi:hypothetical protein
MFITIATREISLAEERARFCLSLSAIDKRRNGPRGGGDLMRQGPRFWHGAVRLFPNIDEGLGRQSSRRSCGHAADTST